MTDVTTTRGAERITAAIRMARRERGFALAPFLTAGYPNVEACGALLGEIAANADIVELGIPFSDPIADGPTIQHASRVALDGGVTIDRALEMLRSASVGIPVIAMTYLNPLLTYGFARFAEAAASVGIDGIIVPDLPVEESVALREAVAEFGLCVISMVTPATPDDRMKQICAQAKGFVYATTICGVTGAANAIDDGVGDFVKRIARHTDVPILAGFGIRSADDAERLADHCDGVIIGSALIESIDRGDSPAAFLRGVRPAVANRKGSVRS